MDQFFEDLEEGYAVTVGPYVLSAEAITDFAQAWDPQPVHLRDDKSAGPVSGLISSGLHTMVATMREFVVGNLFTGNIVLGVGFDDVRLKAPVRPTDQLMATATLTDMRQSQSHKDLGVLTWRVEAGTADHVVMHAKVINLIRTRPNGGFTSDAHT